VEVKMVPCWGYRNKSELYKVTQPPDVASCRSSLPDVGGKLDRTAVPYGLTFSLSIHKPGLVPTRARKQR